MALQQWTYDPAKWPPSFGRLWLWTMFSERAHHDRVLSVAAEIGATDIIVLLNDSPKSQPAFGLRPNRDTTLELAKKVRGAGLSYHMSSWLDPSAEYVNRAAGELSELAEVTKATSLCIDAEGEYRLRIRNHLQFVAETISPAFAGFPVPIGVTSFAGLPGEIASLLAWAVAEHNGYGMPQVYGTLSDPPQEWQHNRAVYPDRIAAMGWRTWSKFTDRLVAIVAAYGNPHPGFDVASALEAQLSRSEYEGFNEAAVWTEESIVGGGQRATTRREVLSELDITGKNTVIDDGTSLVKPLVIGGGVAVASAATYRWWGPWIGRAWRAVRGA